MAAQRRADPQREGDKLDADVRQKEKEVRSHLGGIIQDTETNLPFLQYG